MKKIYRDLLRLGAVLFLTTTLSLGQAMAQESIEGEGRFQSTQEDSLTFVRSQLLYQAFRDVLTKEMRVLGLDGQAFWQKYEERFQSSFDSVRADLVQKYEITSENVTTKQKQDYEKELRAKELMARSRFGNIARAIDSYSIKNMSRAAQSAQSRYLTLEAKVNRRMLTSVYNEFMREGRGRYFSQLIISPSFQLKEGSWSDLGVQTEEELTNVVKQHWTQWFQTHLNRYVSRVQMGDSEIEKKVEEYMKVSSDIFSEDSLSLSQTQEKEGELNPASTAAISNSLWLKINLRFSKLSESEILKNQTIRYEGELVLIDLKTQQIIHAQDFTQEEHTYSVQDPANLSSNIASFLYRMPLPEFEKISRALGDLDSRSKVLRLTLENMRSIEDFYQFREALVKKGVTEDFSPRLIEYNGVAALIDLHFKGERSLALERLRSLQNTRFSEEKSLELQSVERPLEFKMIYRVMPASNGGQSSEDAARRG